MEQIINSDLHPLTHLSEDSDSAFRKMFRDIDHNHDGKISKQEFIYGLATNSHIDISTVEAERLFSNIVSSSKEYVTLDQFVEVIFNTFKLLRIK
jgi:Ca2+-binding EF-hand superfamily protein